MSTLKNAGRLTRCSSISTRLTLTISALFLLYLLHQWLGQNVKNKEYFPDYLGKYDNVDKKQESRRVLFFNRVPKTGSEMLVLLLTWLQSSNGFTHVRLRDEGRRHLTQEQQISLLSDVAKKIRNSTTSFISFDRHVHYINFSAMEPDVPVYINILREPIAKLQSRFYYARATPRPGGYTPPWSTSPVPTLPYTTLDECVAAGDEYCTFWPGQSYDLTIPYFCGHEPYCRKLGNVEALSQALRHLHSSYAVVGVLEELNATLAVLERYLPRFFEGVQELYHLQLGAPHLNKNYERHESLSAAAEAALRVNLSLELRFYEHVRQRLLRQYATLGVGDMTVTVKKKT